MSALEAYNKRIWKGAFQWLLKLYTISIFDVQIRLQEKYAHLYGASALAAAASSGSHLSP